MWRKRWLLSRCPQPHSMLYPSFVSCFFFFLSSHVGFMVVLVEFHELIASSRCLCKTKSCGRHFFFFCRRCSSQLELCRKTWAMLVSHRPAVNHRVTTILAGLLTLTPYHDGCWAAGRPRPHFGNYLPRVYAQLFFLLSAGYFQFNPKDILSHARRRERSLFFYISVVYWRPSV